MLTTADLLTKVLETLFRRKTVNVGAFANSEGPVRDIPLGYFSSDRLKKHPEKPINGLAYERVVMMARAALSGDSYYDAPTVSGRVRRFLVNNFGVETRDFVLVGTNDSDYEFKVGAQVAFLQRVMSIAVGKEAVDEAEVAQALADEVADYRASAGWRGLDETPFEGYAHGVDDFYFRVDDVGYGDLIDSVGHSLDILHFHGLTWTNSNREFLGRCLARPGVDARVVLLDPSSEFFGGFARYIGAKPELLQAKLEEAEEIWRTLARDAHVDPKSPSRLRIFRGDFYPAKSIYRFDRSIVVTPRTTAKPKGQFMAYRCTDCGPQSAYRVHLAEFESVLKYAVPVWDSRH